jgi:hypothetical protein
LRGFTVELLGKEGFGAIAGLLLLGLFSEGGAAVAIVPQTLGS